MNKIVSMLVLLLFSASVSIAETRSVSFGNLKDGDTVTSPLHVEMLVQGLTVAPAGTMTENTGHFHLIIDSPPVAEGEVVPADENHIHFGKGQTSANVDLAPGAHTVILQFADGAHRSYGPDLISTLHVTVKK